MTFTAWSAAFSSSSALTLFSTRTMTGLGRVCSLMALSEAASVPGSPALPMAVSILVTSTGVLR